MDENESALYISPKKAAKMLGVSVVSIRRYMAQKENPIPHTKINDRFTRIKVSDLISWMDSMIAT